MHLPYLNLEARFVCIVLICLENFEFFLVNLIGFWNNVRSFEFPNVNKETESHYNPRCLIGWSGWYACFVAYLKNSVRDDQKTAFRATIARRSIRQKPPSQCHVFLPWKPHSQLENYFLRKGCNTFHTWVGIGSDRIWCSYCTVCHRHQIRRQVFFLLFRILASWLSGSFIAFSLPVHIVHNLHIAYTPVIFVDPSQIYFAINDLGLL